MLNIYIEFKSNLKDFLFLLFIIIIFLFLYGLFLIYNNYVEGYYYILLSLLFITIFTCLILFYIIKEDNNIFYDISNIKKGELF